jgi:single-stranded DNA-specific DHH superfamily exonuclease
MNHLNKEVIEKVKSVFLSDNLESKNICLIYDTDADGLSSAVLITKVLEKLDVKLKLGITEVSRANFLSPDNMKKIRDNGINFIISVDIPLAGLNLMSQYNELVSEGVKFLIFDHHEYTKELEQSVYVHPVNLIGKEMATCCTSKMVYDTINDITNLEEYDWIKAVGMLGDLAFLDFPEEVQNIINKYEGKKVLIKSNEDYYNKTKLGKCTIIDLPRSLGENKYVIECYNSYLSASNPDELIKIIGLNKDLKNAQKDIKYYEINFEKLAEKIKDVYLIEIKSDYKLNSSISTIISQKKPNNTFISYQKTGDFYALSARRQDMKYSMRDLLSKSTEGLKDAVGGGHIPAAGGMIRIEDFNIFKEKVLKNHEGCRIK